MSISTDRPRLRDGMRRRVPSAESQVIAAGPPEGSALPLVAVPAASGVDLTQWGAMNRAQLGTWLDRYGAVLFRGFGVRGAEQFGAAVHALSGQTLEYRERSTPRHAVHQNVYTSTEYPRTESIPLHCENSYAHTWPLRLLFHCEIAASTGGETSLADVRRVLARISPDTRKRFERLGVCYVRNLGEGLGVDWRDAFQTPDRSKAEQACRAAGYDYAWHGDRLRLVRNGPAVVAHPRTGQPVWFNHVVLFHLTSLPNGVGDELLREFGAEGLPSNTYYGDGTAIEPEVLAELRDAYARETAAIPWEVGDVLIIDNMLTAHGRAPFTGDRRVLVAMTQPTSSTDLSEADHV